MKSLPSPAYVLAVKHASPAFALSNGRAITRWELGITSPHGSSKLIVPHNELHTMYTEKSDPLFLATAHRDISQSVFYDRRVIVKMKTIYPPKIVLPEDKRLTGKWKLGVDLNEIYQQEHLKQLKEEKPKILVKYYFNGTYYEQEVDIKYLKEFISYRGIVYARGNAALRA